MAIPTAHQRQKLYEFMVAQRFAVIATVSDDHRPEAALVGIAVTPDLELVFETTEATRKFANLKQDPHIALVIGWGDQRTLQYEGIADEPTGSERDSLTDVFFKTWPDLRNHQGWPGLTYFRVRPQWIRFSSYYRPRKVEEVTFELGASDRTTGFISSLRSIFERH
jgi:general stress protein 26